MIFSNLQGKRFISDALFQIIALRMASDSDALSIVYGLKLERPFEETLWHRGYSRERIT